MVVLMTPAEATRPVLIALTLGLAGCGAVEGDRHSLQSAADRIAAIEIPMDPDAPRPAIAAMGGSFTALSELRGGNMAELLLLRVDVPRSLRACTEEIDQILAQLPGANGRPAQRLAAEMDARLRYTGINEILDEGLHAWLTEFIPLVRQLGNAIHSSYLEAA